MGCDGGTIPKRHELVKTRQKPEQRDADMARTAKWKQCAITQTPLVPPIVACELGNLYNKESILEYLLNKSSCDSVPHLRSLKDVKELNLTKNTGYNSKVGELADKYYDTQAAVYICPVAGLEMNGKYSFGFLWSCGCVISAKAIKEVPSEVCHKCGKSFTTKDFVLINSEGKDFERTRTEMEARRAVAKAKRKTKIKHAAADAASMSLANGCHETNGTVLPNACSSSSSKCTEKIARKSSDAKEANKQGASRAKKSKIGPSSESYSKYKTVAEDPNASKVFKSLFTSSEAAQNRPQYRQSNWVTYNPYHL